MKIVLNRSSSPNMWSVEAIQWLYANGMPELGTPVKLIFNNLQRTGPYGYLETLQFFKLNKNKPYSGPIFSSDDLFVLSRYPVDRTNPLLVSVFNILGPLSFGPEAKLEIQDIPDGIFFTIETDKNGFEFIAEEHRTWPSVTASLLK